MCRHFFAVLVLFESLNLIESLSIAGLQEGRCNQQIRPVEGVDMNWIRSVPRWFIPAGSQYILYRGAAGNSFFTRAREFEFYYGLCPSVEFDFTSTPMSADAYAFGSYAGTYTFTLSSQVDGAFNLVPQEPIPGAGQHLYAIITLTDNENYFFAYKCWANVNQRGWDLFTIEPEVSPTLQKTIEDHAEAQGFDRTKFEFLRYDLCSDPRYQPHGRNATVN